MTTKHIKMFKHNTPVYIAFQQDRCITTTDTHTQVTE